MYLVYIYIYIIKILVHEKLYRQTDSGIICVWENRLFKKIKDVRALLSGTLQTITPEKRLKTGSLNREKMWQKEMGNFVSLQSLHCHTKYVNYDWIFVYINRGWPKKMYITCKTLRWILLLALCRIENQSCW